MRKRRKETESRKEFRHLSAQILGWTLLLRCDPPNKPLVNFKIGKNRGLLHFWLVHLCSRASVVWLLTVWRAQWKMKNVLVCEVCLADSTPHYHQNYFPWFSWLVPHTPLWHFLFSYRQDLRGARLVWRHPVWRGQSHSTKFLWPRIYNVCWFFRWRLDTIRPVSILCPCAAN